MSVLLKPTPIRYSHQYQYVALNQEEERQQQERQEPLQHQEEHQRGEAMTFSYPDQPSLSYGLFTPPSEIRSSIDSSYYSNTITTSTLNSASMDSNNIIVPPPTNTRYDLRKQPVHQNVVHPSNSYPNNHYNNYMRPRRRSNSTSNSTTANSSSTLDASTVPPIDFESRDFNIGEFTATLVCLLWFEPIAIVEYAETYNEHNSQLFPLTDDSIPVQDFIGFCTRIIRTTAVSKEVALLGLLFILRLRMRNPDVQAKTGSQWRIFTIALMLGNKILDDNTYTNKTWADVTRILNVEDIKVMEVEFLSQMRYNLFVTAEQWNEWKVKVSRMYQYHRDSSRQRNMKVYRPSIPPSPPVSSTAATSPSFNDQLPYLPGLSGSPFRTYFNPQNVPERMSSPHRLPPMDESPASAATAVHARVSRKRSREENVLPGGLQPPTKRYQQQFPGPLGIQIPVQPQQRVHYPSADANQHMQPYAPQPVSARSSVSLETTPATTTTTITQNTSPSYSMQQVYPLQPASPSYPTSPYAASPLSPYSTASTSGFNSLSPYASLPHRQMQPSTTPQPQLLDSAQQPSGYASGFSSPYKYLQNRFSPYAPVRPVRTLPSQFNPPRMQWNTIPPMSSEELWYQPIGLHGHSGLRRGIPQYNPVYSYHPPPHHYQQQTQGQQR